MQYRWQELVSSETPSYPYSKLGGATRVYEPTPVVTPDQYKTINKNCHSHSLDERHVGVVEIFLWLEVGIVEGSIKIVRESDWLSGQQDLGGRLQTDPSACTAWFADEGTS